MNRIGRRPTMLPIAALGTLSSGNTVRTARRNHFRTADGASSGQGIRCASCAHPRTKYEAVCTIRVSSTRRY